MSPLAYILSLPVRAYRLVFSPWVGHNCRFQPTCSAYALEALEVHGPFKGSWLVLHRLARCHPFGGSGYDPVPGTDPDHDRDKARLKAAPGPDAKPGSCPCCSGKGSEPDARETR